MKKRLNVFILIALLILITGCEVKSVTIEPIIMPAPVEEQVKATIPLDERRFIYNNGLTFEQQEINVADEKKINTHSYYPIISGLKNKLIQDKINKEIFEVGKKLLSEYETEFLALNQELITNINGKSASSYIAYNFNNVIFVEYGAYIDTVFKDGLYYPCSKNVYYGYDLNTGEKIALSDVFKLGIDYRSKINSFISQYIIENNYDDYEAERMTKPFKGIKDDQSFTLGFEGLRIILDEKNDEFFNYGYSDQILIPFDYFGDDLYIFDKYFDESNNIYEQEKLSKRLLPNKLEFKLKQIIQEDNPKYNIYIYEGAFINVLNKDIEKKLNELVVPKADIEAFKVKALNSTDPKMKFSLGHVVNTFINAGGYLSVGVLEQFSLGDVNEFERTNINYDFNKDKEMRLSDLFEDGIDFQRVFKDYIRKMNIAVTDEMIEAGVTEAVNSNNYFFDEYAVTIKFSPAGSKLDPHEEWISVPFDAFGIENISLFK